MGALMPWAKIDDGFTDHPKVIAAGPLASWLYVCGLTYCARLLTDGFVPTGQVRKLADVDGAMELADKLVSVGLWSRVDGGFQIHDYLEYNPSAEKVKAERKAAQERMQRARSGEVRANNGRSSGAGAEEVQPPRPVPYPSPSPSRPVPDPGDKTPPLPPEGNDVVFDELWALAINRNSGVKVARAAFDKAIKRAPPEVILAGFKRHVPVWETFEDKTKIPHVSTWLNQDRWTVENPIPPSNGRAPTPLRNKTSDPSTYFDLGERYERQGL